MFNVANTVKDAVGIVRPLATKKGLSLLHHMDSAAADVGDAMRLRQIILNLLSNAIKFTMQGAVTLRIGLHERDGKYMLSFCVRILVRNVSSRPVRSFKIFSEASRPRCKIPVAAGSVCRSQRS